MQWIPASKWIDRTRGKFGNQLAYYRFCQLLTGPSAKGYFIVVMDLGPDKVVDWQWSKN
jgi:hypothetical protein